MTIEERVPTRDEVIAYLRDLRNWGRWGDDDQRGAINLITPEKTVAAARLVRDGVTVTLQHFVSEEDAMDSGTFAPTEIWMTSVDPATGLPDGVTIESSTGALSGLPAMSPKWTASPKVRTRPLLVNIQ